MDSSGTEGYDKINNSVSGSGYPRISIVTDGQVDKCNDYDFDFNMLKQNPNSKMNYDQIGSVKESKITWLSRLTFSWLTPIMDKAYNSCLQIGDFYELPEFDTPRYKLRNFTYYWNEEMNKCKVNDCNYDDSSKSKTVGSEDKNKDSESTLKREATDNSYYDIKSESDQLLGSETKDQHQKQVLLNTKEMDKVYIKEKSSLKKYPSLIKVLFYTFKWHFLSIFCLVVLADSCVLAQSIVFRKLLLCMQGFSTGNPPTTNGVSNDILKKGMCFVLLLTSLTIISPLLKQQEHRLVNDLGRYLRSLMSGVLYRKLMRMGSIGFNGGISFESSPLSQSTKNSKTISEGTSFVNLIGNDVCRFNRLITAHLFYSGTFLLAASTICLCSQLGFSALFGVLVVILNVVFSVSALYFRALERRPYLSLQDQRIRYANEYISNIKIIKSYAWEECFTKKISDCRDGELISLLKQGTYRALSMGIYSTTMQATLVTCIFYALAGHQLDPATVFFAEGLFETLSFALSSLPFSYASFHDILLSCTRIRDFLMVSEKSSPPAVKDAPKPKQTVSLGTAKIMPTQFTCPTISSRGSVSFEDVHLYWPDGHLMLKDVSFKAAAGEIIAILGPIGSGKTGLLSAIIGEIAPYKGKILKSGRLAYVAQVPWVQTGTIKDNILFGAAFDPVWYDAVIKACALWMDFQVLPEGDRTLVGEKGLNLSGGQRQRISLARAVYQKADIYVLDDCLSAVDSHVSAHIFRNCICGLLSNKCVILVTHKLEIIPNVDQIILFDPTKRRQVYSGSPIDVPAPVLKKLASELLLAEETESETASRYSLNSHDLRMFDQCHTFDNEPLRGFPSTLPNGSEDASHFDQKEQTQIPPKTTRTGVVDDVVAVDILDALVTSTPGRNDRPSASFGKGRTASVRMSGEELRHHYRKDGDERRKESGSLFSEASADGRNNDKICINVPEELTELSSVSKKIYKAYLKEWGVINMFGVLLCNIAAGLVFSRNMFWLAKWRGPAGSKIDWARPVMFYALLTALYALLHISSSLLVRNGGLNASRVFHNKLLWRLRYTSLSFFEVTPVGKILTRFTTDLSNLDDALPRNIGDLLIAAAKILVITISVSRVIPAFLLCVPPLAYLFYQVSKKYAPMLRQCERLSVVYQAPILSHVVDTVDGLSTIRAFHAQERFIRRMDDAVRADSRIRYHVENAYRWLFIRLEMMGCVAVFIAGTFGVVAVSKDPSTAGIFGAAMTFALSVSSCLNFGTRVLGEIEGVMVGLERIKEYSETTPLEPKPVIESCRPPFDWPNKGEIEIIDLRLRYKPELPPVLDGIKCCIKAGEKIGIVGRTGAGKSSIFSLILRLIDPENGLVKIDGLDISSIGTFDLRTRISIIPQEPVVFSGTIRFNLDPLQQHTDQEIEQALQKSHLYNFVKNLPNGLETILDSGAQVLSTGQKQLLCLARALLRSSKVVLLDEATSSIDPHTDMLVQKTIRLEFAFCTVLAVAHRIQTVLDYDKILVLDSGHIVEFDRPDILLASPHSLFYSLVHGSR
ncbi:ATP-binding cassette [Cryptosporidium xiaoi]|uniref:ATP-binding cassette n=1 Tax=Cryptosporidium xiaoi TaxID=659607 RepID=A0AAV9XY23_9CRYT